MLKFLAICATSLTLVILQPNADSHKAHQTKSGEAPTSPVPDSSRKQQDGCAPENEKSPHIDAYVRVLKTPDKDFYDKAVFWINTALACVGLSGIVVGICTLVYLRKQAREMRNQGDLMRHSLYATRRGNMISRSALEIAQRPWIFFPYPTDTRSALRLLDDSDATTAWQFFLPVENTGNTPGIEVAIRANFEITGPSGITDDFGYPDYAKDALHSMFISAKSTIFTGALDIAFLHLDAVQQKQSRLFFYGWATYQDPFPETPIHRTEFCYEMQIILLAGNQIAFSCSAFGSHNTAT